MNNMIDIIFKLIKKMQRQFSLSLAIIGSMVSIMALLLLFYKDMAIDDKRFAIFIGALASIMGATLAYLMLETTRRMYNRKAVFVSYTHQDTDFVKMLAEDLKNMDIKPLIDRLELKVGDNIRQAVDEMIDRSDYFLVVISENSMKSDWAKKELEQAMARKKKILPILLHSGSIPSELSGVFYADFTEKYEIGLEQLKNTFSSK